MIFNDNFGPAGPASWLSGYGWQCSPFRGQVHNITDVVFPLKWGQQGPVCRHLLVQSSFLYCNETPNTGFLGSKEVYLTHTLEVQSLSGAVLSPGSWQIESMGEKKTTTSFVGIALVFLFCFVLLCPVSIQDRVYLGSPGWLRTQDKN